MESNSSGYINDDPRSMLQLDEADASAAPPSGLGSFEHEDTSDDGNGETTHVSMDYRGVYPAEDASPLVSDTLSAVRSIVDRQQEVLMNATHVCGYDGFSNIVGPTHGELQHDEPSDVIIPIPRKKAPVQEYHNVDYFHMRFPSLFPYARGGPVLGGCDNGGERMSYIRAVRWTLDFHDQRFAKHSSYAIVCFDLWRRSLAAQQSKRLTVKSSEEARVVRGFSASDLLECTQLLKDTKAKRVKDVGYNLQKLWRMVEIVSGNIPGSPANKKKLRNQVWAMTYYMGAPLLYITINPSEYNSPISLCIAGHVIPLFPTCDPANLPCYDRRSEIIANNPKAASDFFQYVMQAVLDELVLGGLMGPADAYFGVVETNTRPSLHCHLFAWIRGADPVQILKKLYALQHDKQALDNVTSKWVDFLSSIQDQCANPISDPGHPLQAQLPPPADAQPGDDAQADVYLIPPAGVNSGPPPKKKRKKGVPTKVGCSGR
jgi:hypothetical protein